MSIIISDLCKSFSDQRVIDHLNLNISENRITALVGNNGAGKTTLIRMIADVLKPDSGKIIKSCNSIGVLLGGDVHFFDELTVEEIICFFGKLYGMNTLQIKQRMIQLSDVFDFASFLNRRGSALSRGMRQKVGLIVSFLHNPDFLLLDEPSTGLDIQSVHDVVEFIKYLKNCGKTILLATHNLFEISDLSDEIAVLKEGHITQKVETATFFSACLPFEKSQRLIELMNGGNIIE